MTNRENSKKDVAIKRFGIELAFEAKKRNVNYETLGKEAGVSKDTLYKVLNKGVLSQYSCDRICEGLGWDKAKKGITKEIYESLHKGGSGNAPKNRRSCDELIDEYVEETTKEDEVVDDIPQFDTDDTPLTKGQFKAIICSYINDIERIIREL